MFSPIKTAESHAKIPDGPPLDWYKIRHVPSWFKLGPSIKLQVCIQEDELWTPEMLENKQVNSKKKNFFFVEHTKNTNKIYHSRVLYSPPPFELKKNIFRRV